MDFNIDEEFIPVGIVKDTLDTANGDTLGLDISVSSTGISVISSEGIWLGNLSMHHNDRGDNFDMTRRRLYFKSQLGELLSSITNLQTVVVEDIFSGGNPKTFEQLANLNRVVDEIIFESGSNINIVRIQSRVWKKWIRGQIQDRGGIIRDGGKYLNDKVLVRESLRAMGFDVESLGKGKSLQDRCDALGMSIGYLLHMNC